MPKHTPGNRGPKRATQSRAKPKRTPKDGAKSRATSTVKAKPKPKLANKPKPRSTKAGSRTTGSKTKVRNTKAAKRSTAKAGGLRRLLWWVAGVGLGFGLLYTLLLDYQVRARFEGQRWELPARVYAAPLELYPELALRPVELESELRALGYRAMANPSGPGTYRRRGNRLKMVSRRFQFWDGEEPSRTLDLVFRKGRIATLREGGKPAGLVRLDPRTIGGIYPRQSEDRILVHLVSPSPGDTEQADGADSGGEVAVAGNHCGSDDTPSANCAVLEVPPLLVQALLAVEDRHFYEHRGLDPWAIGRAMWANLRAGRTVQGGSTLTQQLVKNLYLSNRRTLGRKAKEAIMTLLLEAHYTKDEILQAYLNEVFLGQDGSRAIHGFGLASWYWFGRPLDELQLPQLATLVAMVRGASYYDPRRHPERVLERRNRVIRLMSEQGFIDQSAADHALAEELGVSPKPQHGTSPYPAFLDLVRRQLRRDYRQQDLYTEGLRIFTSLDPRAQRQAEKALVDGIPRLERDYRLPRGKLQGAIVISAREGGEVQALVGGRDAGFEGFNRALDARRPVGSLIKPAVYLAALAKPRRWSLGTLLNDTAVRLKGRDGKPWTPRNFDHKAHGKVPLATALARSYNLATVHLGLAVGLERVVDTLQRLGLGGEVAPYPSLLLGAVERTPVEIASLYQTLAGGGFRTPLRAIRAVVNADGAPLQRYGLDVESVADPRAVFLLDTALQGVVAEGTARGLNKRFPRSLYLAGKTGTTDDLRDSWFAGFSGDRLGLVWVGRDDNRPAGLTGSKGAMRIWGDAMHGLHLAPLRLPRPQGIAYSWVDPATGRGSAEGCAGAVLVPFYAEALPEPGGSCGPGRSTAQTGQGAVSAVEPKRNRPVPAGRPERRRAVPVRPSKGQTSRFPLDWLYDD